MVISSRTTLLLCFCYYLPYSTTTPTSLFINSSHSMPVTHYPTAMAMHAELRPGPAWQLLASKATSHSQSSCSETGSLPSSTITNQPTPSTCSSTGSEANSDGLKHGQGQGHHSECHGHVQQTTTNPCTSTPCTSCTVLPSSFQPSCIAMHPQSLGLHAATRPHPQTPSVASLWPLASPAAHHRWYSSQSGSSGSTRASGASQPGQQGPGQQGTQGPVTGQQAPGQQQAQPGGSQQPPPGAFDDEDDEKLVGSFHDVEAEGKLETPGLAFMSGGAALSGESGRLHRLHMSLRVGQTALGRSKLDV